MAAASSPETALSGAGGPKHDEDDEVEEEEEEEECRICRLPTEPDRPLRHPCACRGSIRFVHDDCLLRWLATRQKLRCEVCKRDISTRPLYASDAPAKLPISEFMLGLPNKLMGLLPLVFAIYVVRDFVIHLTALWAWRLAFAKTFSQVQYLFSLRLTTTSIHVLFVLWIALARRVAPFAIGPFARWIGRLETRHPRFGRIDGMQVLALRVVEGFIMVFIADIALAFVVGFLPFSMGRIILWCLSCFGLSNVDEADSHTSRTSILLTGYGFMFSGAVAFAGLNSFCQYLKGERLMLAIFFRWLLGIFVREIADLITVANICLNLLTAIIIYPLFFGWLLDICTSKMFGATMPQRFELLFASSFASIALHWHIGLIFFKLGSRLFRPFCQILRPRVVFPCVCQDIFAPFYKFHSKKLHSLFVGVISMIMVMFVPIEVANRLVPELFPLDITYFRCDTDDRSFWQAPQNYADSVFGLLLLRFFICHTQTLLYHEWSVKKVMQYSFVTIWPDGASGHEVGSSVAPKDQYGSTNEAKDKWRLVALNVALVWLTVVTFNVAMLTLPILVGRALLSTISRLPFAGSLKSNDLFALVVGFGIMSTIIAAFRDSFACMTSGRTHMLSLKRSLIMFLWLVIIPFLMGLLVDLSLISPFAGRDNEDRVLDFFYSWFIGQHLLRVWLGLVHRSRTIPFLVYFIGERWDSKLTEAKANWISGVISVCWFFQHLLMPMATKLLTMLVVPYVFAKGLFPSFGYSATVNTAVYHFIWLGNLTFYVFCYLAKVSYAILHDSIRDDLYIIGQRLEDVAE